MRVRIGAGLYTGQDGDYRDAVRLAVAAEEAGFDAFWVSEHHGLPDGYLPSPLTLLAALAPVTERIELGAGVVVAPLHHPLRIAEDAAVVDRLSGGRLLLGLGLGYAAHEYRAFRVDPATRGRRLTALVEALRAAWTGEPFSCAELGLRDVRVTPRPARPIPVWLGGYAAAAVERAGRIADGHLLGRGDPPVVDATSARLAAVRRPDDPAFTRGITVTCVLDAPGGGGEQARAAFARQQRVYDAIQAGRSVYGGLVDARPGGGGPALRDASVQLAGDVPAVVDGMRALLARLRGWADVHVMLRLLFPEPDLDVQLERLATVGREVLPRLREG